MQIGTGNNRLPGSAVAAEEADAVTPAPSAPVAPPVLSLPPRVRRKVSARELFLMAVLVLIVAAIALVLTGRAPKVEDVTPLFARLVAMVPRLTSAAPTNTVVLTPTQRKIVSEYSPVVPINETKRVKELVHNRVAAPDADNATNPVVAVSNTPPVVTPPSPLPVEKPLTVKEKPPAAAAIRTAERVIVWPDLQVSAVIGGANAKWFALINGQTKWVGEKIENATVISISTDHVTLEFSGEQRNYTVGTRR